jgi:diaminopimelate epimerase
MTHRFLKMNGLGNDFIVVDARRSPYRPTPDQVRALSARGDGAIGCDQFIVLEPSSRADLFMRIWNADGTQVQACGNATRCVGQLLLDETGAASATIETDAGLLGASRPSEGQAGVTVDMGVPILDWSQIPLSQEMDTRGIELQVGPIDAPILHTPGCVNMGNPHVVFFVPDIETAPVREVGPMIEHHFLFPEGVNVGFAQILSPDRIRLKVWERGAGLTKACGTGACAALVAAHRRGLTGREATLVLDGGELHIAWRASDDHVLMTGAVALDYEGQLP